MSNYFITTVDFALISNLQTQAIAQHGVVAPSNVWYYFLSVGNTLNYISTFSESYTVNFQTTQPFILTNYPYKLYSLCFPCTFLFCNQLYTLYTPIERFQTKYKDKTYGIIIVENLPATIPLKLH